MLRKIFNWRIRDDKCKGYCSNDSNGYKTLIGKMNGLYNYIHYSEYARNYHKILFEKYKGLYMGRDVVLFATGPSANYYIPIEGAVHVGINYAFLKTSIHFDYLFIHDKKVIEDSFAFLSNYKSNLFCAYHISASNAKKFNVSSKDLCALNAHRFFLSDPGRNWLDENIPNVINPDITNGLFMDRGAGTVFSALQFVLYTGPRRIYLVGCDCTAIGHFYNENDEHINLLPKTRSCWQEFSYMKHSVYPHIEIVSINPCSLKGLFKDVYTQNYVENHPELKREEVIILENGRSSYVQK